MESLSETPWDVVISGTGLQQSLLALALSRSDKKILHVDKNPYYGGADAAFSLQEAEEWVQQVNDGSAEPSGIFADATLQKINEDDSSSSRLAHSRSYTLSLSPQIIYAKSKLLSYLVSSKVYRQLEFQAVGAWWLYNPTDTPSDEGSDSNRVGQLKRIPNGREDVFTDSTIDLRAKRGLMKFLKFVVDYENQLEVWESHADEPLPSFLTSQFRLPPALQTVILSLTLSLDVPEKTIIRYALPRISRHLTSIGIFGPGFGAVIPKWGGGSEIAQVACRAQAVGGGIYVLGTGIQDVEPSDSGLKIKLANGDTVKSASLVDSSISSSTGGRVAKSIIIISTPLEPLFATTAEGAPTSSVSVVVFPSDSLTVNGIAQKYPVYVMVHSSDTGECPTGQCVLYCTTMATPVAEALLSAAVDHVLKSVVSDEQTSPLFSLFYRQAEASPKIEEGKTFSLGCTGLDLAFDDSVLENVEQAWQKLARPDPDAESTFMKFDDREGVQPDDDY